MAFYALANLMDLYDGLILPVSIAGKKLLLIHENAKTYVIADRCPHMDAPLATGDVANGAIRCRAHGIEFDLENGKALGSLSNTLDCLVHYPLVYEGNRVGVDL